MRQPDRHGWQTGFIIKGQTLHRPPGWQPRLCPNTFVLRNSWSSWKELLLPGTPRSHSEFYAPKGFWLLNNHDLPGGKRLTNASPGDYPYRPLKWVYIISNLGGVLQILQSNDHILQKRKPGPTQETPSLRSDKQKELSANLRSSDPDSAILILWFFFLLRHYFFWFQYLYSVDVEML